jgi:polysaccharide export outer membrane protein
MFCTAAAWSQAVQKQSLSGDHPAAAAGTTAPPAPSDQNYVIGAEDVLSVNVWKESEVSVSEPVRLDGRISIPLIHDIQAAGLTPMALAAEISDKLNKYISDPQVTVIVTAINSKRVYLMGQIARPGAYPLLPDQTVLQALAIGGGFSQWANLSKIYILRNQGGRQTKLPFNYRQVIKGDKPEENLVLQPGDTIVVP